MFVSLLRLASDLFYSISIVTSYTSSIQPYGSCKGRVVWYIAPKLFPLVFGVLLKSAHRTIVKLIRAFRMACFIFALSINRENLYQLEAVLALLNCSRHL